MDVITSDGLEVKHQEICIHIHICIGLCSGAAMAARYIEEKLQTTQSIERPALN